MTRYIIQCDIGGNASPAGPVRQRNGELLRFDDRAAAQGYVDAVNIATHAMPAYYRYRVVEMPAVPA